MNLAKETPRFIKGVMKRTRRDIGALPAEAAAWVPPAGAGEQSWSIGQLVRHIVTSRRMFLDVYVGAGWKLRLPDDLPQSEWLAELDASAEDLLKGVDAAPEEWLTRMLPVPGTEATISGWTALMRFIEHEVHHRSQVDTIAGLQGWNVPQIFNRSAEEVARLT